MPQSGVARTDSPAAVASPRPPFLPQVYQSVHDAFVRLETCGGHVYNRHEEDVESENDCGELCGVSFCFVSFLFLWRGDGVAFSENCSSSVKYTIIVVPFFFLCRERAVCTFSFRMVFFYLVTSGWIFDFFLPNSVFYLVTTGWIFDISLLRENSINQPTNQ